MKPIRITYDRKGNVGSFAEQYYASTTTARRTLGTPALRACQRS
jgi:hypothetical protein